MYHSTPLGCSLRLVLDELVQTEMLSEQVAQLVMEQFDKSVSGTFSNCFKFRTKFTAEKLVTYRYVDKTWTLVLSNVDFKEVAEILNVGHLKMIAQDENKN